MIIDREVREYIGAYTNMDKHYEVQKKFCKSFVDLSTFKHCAKMINLTCALLHIYIL